MGGRLVGELAAGGPRPDDYGIDRVVIHVTQGSYRVLAEVFQDPAHGAAAHDIVRKDGHITQMIRELDVAFHAGNRGYNERSVGIEHEGFVERASSFTDAMYAASARLTAAVCGRYGIPADRAHIIGHVEAPGHGPHRPRAVLDGTGTYGWYGRPARRRSRHAQPGRSRWRALSMRAHRQRRAGLQSPNRDAVRRWRDGAVPCVPCCRCDQLHVNSRCFQGS